MPKRVGAVKGHRRDDQHRARARDSVQGCHLTKLWGIILNTWWVPRLQLGHGQGYVLCCCRGGAFRRALAGLQGDGGMACRKEQRD